MLMSRQTIANSMRNQWLFFVALWSAIGWGWLNIAVSQDSPAGNEEVARVMREFEGRGDLGDGSDPATPAETIARLKVPDDLQMELVAGEPDVTQPIHISFDFKGRMWVVQYRQYPFPAGLKVVRYDQHLRAVFDKMPVAPPNHVPGADCVTVWEDTNGDGSYDSHRDVIQGLNIATSVAISTSGIWVMNPPYLLHYPDADQDAQVDGDPTVHLTGFGLEDTHAVANSLRLGPDGWLYGANGSTTTASIRAPLSDRPDQATSFQGQCIWRYHPESHRFEIFAEGGGNTFGLEIERERAHVFRNESRQHPWHVLSTRQLWHKVVGQTRSRSPTRMPLVSFNICVPKAIAVGSRKRWWFTKTTCCRRDIATNRSPSTRCSDV